MVTQDKPFRLTRATRIVIADGATLADKRGPELLRKALRTRCALDVPLVRARAVVQSENVIAVGEPGRNTVVDRLLAAENRRTPAHAGGYAVVVRPRAVLVAGQDAEGTLQGTKSLLPLLDRDDDGPLVHPVRAADGPTSNADAAGEPNRR